LEEAYVGRQEESGRYSKHAAIPPDMQNEHDKQIAELLARRDYTGAQELEAAFTQRKQQVIDLGQEEHDQKIAGLIARKDYTGDASLAAAYDRDRPYASSKQDGKGRANGKLSKGKAKGKLSPTQNAQEAQLPASKRRRQEGAPCPAQPAMHDILTVLATS